MGIPMTYKRTRLEEVAFQRQFEEAVSLAMHHVGINYSDALDLLFTPLGEEGGLCVADFVRRGQLPLAKQALVQLIETRKRTQTAQRLVYPSRVV
ncbi:hypothetical protein EBU99_02535 [bacterium]|nr:hypothetical protein [bacterium]